LSHRGGSVFAAGDAVYRGSAATPLGSAVVGMASTPDGRGYWLVTAKGRVMAYGDARYFGSIATVRLRGAIVGMAPTADGRGYWLAARDGGVFAFGDARFKGSRPGRLMALGRISPSTGPERVIGMATTVEPGSHASPARGGKQLDHGDRGRACDGRCTICAHSDKHYDGPNDNYDRPHHHYDRPHHHYDRPHHHYDRPHHHYDRPYDHGGPPLRQARRPLHYDRNSALTGIG
jgi:hypothetical protein